MMDDRTARMAQATRLIEDEPPRRGRVDTGRLERLCSVLTKVLPASGVGVSLITDEVSTDRTLAASDSRSWVLEELQFSLREGPCIDAHELRRPVLEPDLREHGIQRWPFYSRAAQQHDMKAVFAFPLQVGAFRTGALDIYRVEEGPLSPEALAHAVTFADVALGLVVEGQAGVGDSRSSLDLDGTLASPVEVHQAQGMVMVDLSVGAEEAVARMRAHAYAHDRTLADVAKDIVAGGLTIDRDDT